MCISCSPAVHTLYCSAGILRPRGFGLLLLLLFPHLASFSRPGLHAYLTQLIMFSVDQIYRATLWTLIGPTYHIFTALTIREQISQ